MNKQSDISTNAPKLRVTWIFLVAVGFLLFVIFPLLFGSGREARLYKSPVHVSADGLRFALKQYKSEYGDFPSGNYAQICRTLCGANPKSIEFFERDPKRLNAKGEIIDPWGTPFLIDLASYPVSPHVQSAGKNRQFEPRTKESDDFYSWQD